MYGQNIGQLNIYIRTLNQGTVLLKSISDNQNQTWHRLEVNLQSNTPYQVLIEGKVGAGYLGDIAIDDISFTPGCGASGSSSGGFTTPAVSTQPPIHVEVVSFHVEMALAFLSPRSVTSSLTAQTTQMRTSAHRHATLSRTPVDGKSFL
uniref:MAM domain-containing glycosylphosphatidylinositol anchor protein 2-like n=1 Tax=Crassostrea virginica TaxID=6565 RepID=A0A8B8EH23_CRAVI|nr:MAM domain-containing glycosylphosphatidylinositol anchor protein 2-like [Crassostrea virginica]